MENWGPPAKGLARNTAWAYAWAQTMQEPECPSTDRWMKKAMVFTYNGISLGQKKDEIMLFCSNMMDGRLSTKEGRQTETNTARYHPRVKPKTCHK